jgi:hypothetical protein
MLDKKKYKCRLLTMKVFVRVSQYTHLQEFCYDSCIVRSNYVINKKCSLASPLNGADVLRLNHFK